MTCKARPQRRAFFVVTLPKGYEMTELKTLLRLMAPDDPGAVPPLRYNVMLPGYVMLGPANIHLDFYIAKRLLPGDYRLMMRVPPDIDIILDFPIEPEGVTRIRLANELMAKGFKGIDPDAPLPKLNLFRRESHVAQFWVGHCDSPARFDALLSEDDFWAIEDEEVRDNAPLSQFAASQGERWFDHDFMEGGFCKGHEPLAERFEAYSWAAAWAPELEARARKLGLIHPDSFIMMTGDADRRYEWEMKTPKDIDLPGVKMRYAGEIAFGAFSIPPYWWRSSPRR